MIRSSPPAQRLLRPRADGWLSRYRSPNRRAADIQATSRDAAELPLTVQTLGMLPRKRSKWMIGRHKKADFSPRPDLRLCWGSYAASREGRAMMKLYQFTFSHYCEKARWALEYKGIAYQPVNLLPGSHLRTVQKLTPKERPPGVVA